MNLHKLLTKEGKELIVYEGNGNFDKGLSELPKGVSCASTEEFAGARLLVPVTHQLWTRGMWTGDNYNYFPNGDIIIASRDYNPLLRNSAKATKLHYDGKEFYLDTKTVDELRSIAKEDVSDAIKSGALLVPRKNVKASFPTNRLADEAVPYFLFRENAKPYGQILNENNVFYLSQYTISQGYVKEPLSRALWVLSIDNSSVLIGSNYNLNYSNGRVCGVQRNADISCTKNPEDFFVCHGEEKNPKVVALTKGTIDEKVES